MAALEELCWALPVLMTYNWHSQVIILLNVIQVLLLLFLLSTRIDLVILSQLSIVVVGVIVLIVVIVAVFDIDNPLNRIVNCMSRRRRQERALISLEPSYIYMCLCMCDDNNMMNYLAPAHQSLASAWLVQNSPNPWDFNT